MDSFVKDMKMNEIWILYLEFDSFPSFLSDSSRQQIQKISGTSLGDRGNRSLRKRRQSDHEPEGTLSATHVYI